MCRSKNDIGVIKVREKCIRKENQERMKNGERMLKEEGKFGCMMIFPIYEM